jgi:uncharacterized protein YndB with AHSA1/START domain
MTPARASGAAEMVVRKTFVVNAPQAHTFSVFTEGFGTWWPLASHHIGKADAQTAVIEPHAGGRWFERGVDGSECDWGRVLVWAPPDRIVLSWEINPDWQHDRTLSTEVEVRFIAEGEESTRVEFEHRNLDRFGEKAESMYAILGSDSGWTGILEAFAEHAASRR